MMMKRRALYTTIEEFLYDDDFIRYVLDADAIESGASAEWEHFAVGCPHLRSLFLKAKDILLHLDEQQLLTPEQTARLKSRIFMSLHPASTKR